MPDVKLSTGVDESGVAAGMARLRGVVKQSEGAIAGSFATMFAAGSLIEFGKRIFDLAGRVEDVSERFAVSTKFVQQWANAGAEAGVTFEDVGVSLNKLTIAQSKANGGSAEMIKHFASLGVSVDDLRQLNSEQIWEKIAHSSMNAEDMVALFGRGALKLIPVLQAVADGSTHLGDVIDDQVIKKLDAAGDAFTRFQNNLTIKGGNLLGKLMDIGGQIKKVTPFALLEDKILGGDPTAVSTPKPHASITAGAGETPPAAPAHADQSDSLRERLARIDRQNALDALENEGKLKSLTAERLGLEAALGIKKSFGARDDEQGLQLQVSIAQRTGEIAKLQRQIADDKTRANKEATKEREQADAAVAAAAEQNAELVQTLAGHDEVAERMKLEFDYALKIKEALDDQNTALAAQLAIQRDLLLNAAKARAEKEAAEKREKEAQESINNLGSYSPQDLASIAAANSITQIRQQTGNQNFGTGGAAGGPSFREQLQINSYNAQQSVIAARPFTSADRMTVFYDMLRELKRQTAVASPPPG